MTTDVKFYIPIYSVLEITITTEMVTFYKSVQTNTIPEYGHIIHLTTKSHHILIFHTFEVRVHLAILRISELFMFYSICYTFCGLGDSFCRYFLLA